MNWLDLTILLAVAAGALLGFRSGLVRQVIGLLSWIAALWAATQYHSDLGELIVHLSGWTPPVWAELTIVVVLVLTFFYLLAHWCRTMVDALHLKAADRLTGSLAGAGKVILIAVILISYIHFNSAYESFPHEAVDNSYLSGIITSLLEKAVG